MRDRYVENQVLQFYKALPQELLKFPIDIFKIANIFRKNIKIISYQKCSTEQNISLKSIISFCQSETGCALKQGNNFIIMYNDADDIVYQRKVFTIAHEFGHIRMNHFNDILATEKIFLQY